MTDSNDELQPTVTAILFGPPFAEQAELSEEPNFRTCEDKHQ